jgi:hypothetical protein
LLLAQRQEAREMIDIGVCDKDGTDWRLPQAAAGMQAGGRYDLLAEIRRSIEKKPALAIGADC